jgi:hypothetical protein
MRTTLTANGTCRTHRDVPQNSPSGIRTAVAGGIVATAGPESRRYGRRGRCGGSAPTRRDARARADRCAAARSHATTVATSPCSSAVDGRACSPGTWRSSSMLVELAAWTTAARCGSERPHGIFAADAGLPAESTFDPHRSDPMRASGLFTATRRSSRSPPPQRWLTTRGLPRRSPAPGADRGQRLSPRQARSLQARVDRVIAHTGSSQVRDQPGGLGRRRHAGPAARTSR